MNLDSFFQQIYTELRVRIEDQREGLCTIAPDKLAYHQGIITGLREALQVLEGELDRLDK